MILSHVDIAAALQYGDIGIDPYDEAYLQPASVDLRLGEIETGTDIIVPGEFCLASTMEVIRLDGKYAANVAGKSSLARRGLIVEAAGWIDPGFEGQLTLELHNMSAHPIIVPLGQAICQIVFLELKTPATTLYHGHYQGQRGATPDRRGTLTENQSSLFPTEDAVKAALANRKAKMPTTRSGSF